MASGSTLFQGAATLFSADCPPFALRDAADPQRRARLDGRLVTTAHDSTARKDDTVR